MAAIANVNFTFSCIHDICHGSPGPAVGMIMNSTPFTQEHMHDISIYTVLRDGSVCTVTMLST